jgi:hypothetical protein
MLKKPMTESRRNLILHATGLRTRQSVVWSAEVATIPNYSMAASGGN